MANGKARFPTALTLGVFVALTALSATSYRPAAAADKPAAKTKVSAEWADYLTALQPLGDRVIAALPYENRPEARQDAYVQMLGALMGGYLSLVRGDPSHPVFMPYIGLYENFLVPNPDTVYLVTMIDGAGTYRLSGRRGTINLLNLSALPAFDAIARGGVLADYDFDSLPGGKDGRFSVVLSAKRPEGYTGDWWQLDPRAERLMLREVSDNWGKQDEARVAISRLDAEPRGTRPSAAELQRRISSIGPWIERNVLPPGEMSGPRRHLRLVERGVVNKLEDQSQRPGQMSIQSYFMGVFELAAAEALVVELSPAKSCRYWSILLGDPMGATLDWVNNQSSLNGAQAVADSDGKVRIVIARNDPHVPNWLDTVGRDKGIIQNRWIGCPIAAPPVVTKVAESELRRHLPKETPTVDQGDRARRLLDRREAAQMRPLW